MCDPLTIAASAAAVAAVGGAASSYIQGQEQLKATQKAAYDNAVLQNQQLQEQRSQISKQSANDMTERAKQAQIEQGRLRVITGESGALGFTQDRLLMDSEFQEGTDIATIEANRTAALKQTDFDALSDYNQNISSIHQARNRAPTLLGASLHIGGGLANAYMGWETSRSKPIKSVTLETDK